jgi:hypothetical protein
MRVMALKGHADSMTALTIPLVFKNTTVICRQLHASQLCSSERNHVL